MIATLAQFKARYALSESTDDDAALTTILESVSSRIALAMGRHIDGEACLEEAQRTQVFSPESYRRTLWMSARPVSRVLSVVEGAEGDFADVDPLVEGEDYYVQGRRGGILRKGGYWPAIYEASVQVIYVGGYTPPDPLTEDDFTAWQTGAEYVFGDHVTSGGRYWDCVVGHTAGATFEGDADNWEEHFLAFEAWVTATDYALGALVLEGDRRWECTLAHTAGETFAGDLANWREKFPMPADLVEACLAQAGADWQRRSMVGLSSASSQGGTVSAKEDGLLPSVEETLARYRERMG